MEKIKKYIIYILITCLIIGNLQIPYVFADGNSNQEKNKCTACNSTPTSMQVFINFEVELLGILQGASAKPQSFGTNKSSGLFAGGGLAISKAFLKSTLEKTKNDLDSEIKAVRAARITAALLTIMAASSTDDSLYSIQILFKNEAFVRDYKILQELDMSINDVIRDMGISGIWDDRISTSVKNEILGLQYKYSQTYGNDNNIFENLSISSEIKYRGLLIFLLELNSTMKSMLMALGENTPLLDSRLSDFEDIYSKGNIVASINREYIESIKIDYSCISYVTCDKTVKEALKGIADIKKFGESFGRTMDTIQDADRNLKEAWGSRSSYDGFGGWLMKKQKSEGTGGLTDRQVELLHTVYGIDANHLTSSQIETFKQNFQQMKKEFVNPRKIKKGVSDSNRNYLAKQNDKGKGQQQNYINSLSAEERKSVSEQKYRQEIIKDEGNEKFAENMQKIVNEILIENGKDREIILAGENVDTHYFVQIGAYIHSIVNEEIGDENTEGLVKTLGETCEYQCKEHGGECYSD